MVMNMGLSRFHDTTLNLWPLLYSFFGGTFSHLFMFIGNKEVSTNLWGL